jgi:asparagine synthase (glutamine-hydrolysing)
LAIVDPSSGKQPLLSEDKQLILAANGEIYNHRELRKQFEGKYNFQTESDCEVILALIRKGLIYSDEMYFWFYIYDVESYFIAVITWVLFHYTLVGINMELLCGFRIESIEGYCTKIQLFPPGHYMTSKDGEFVQWYKRVDRI